MLAGGRKLSPPGTGRDSSLLPLNVCIPGSREAQDHLLHGTFTTKAIDDHETGARRGGALSPPPAAATAATIPGLADGGSPAGWRIQSRSREPLLAGPVEALVSSPLPRGVASVVENRLVSLGCGDRSTRPNTSGGGNSSSTSAAGAAPPTRSAAVTQLTAMMTGAPVGTATASIRETSSRKATTTTTASGGSGAVSVQQEASALLATLGTTDKQRAIAAELYQQQMQQFLTAEVSAIVADLHLVQAEINVHFFHIARTVERGGAAAAAAATRHEKQQQSSSPPSPSAAAAAGVAGPSSSSSLQDVTDGTNEAFKTLLRYQAKGTVELQAAIRTIVGGTSPTALEAGSTAAVRTILAHHVTQPEKNARKKGVPGLSSGAGGGGGAASGGASKSHIFNPFVFGLKTAAHLTKCQQHVLNPKVRVGGVNHLFYSNKENPLTYVGGGADPYASSFDDGGEGDGSSPSSMVGPASTNPIAVGDVGPTGSTGGSSSVEAQPATMQARIAPPGDLTPITLLHLQRLLLVKTNELVRVAHVAASLGVAGSKPLADFLVATRFGGSSISGPAAGSGLFQSTHPALEDRPTSAIASSLVSGRSPTAANPLAGLLSLSTSGGGAGGASSHGAPRHGPYLVPYAYSPLHAGQLAKSTAGAATTPVGRPISKGGGGASLHVDVAAVMRRCIGGAVTVAGTTGAATGVAGAGAGAGGGSVTPPSGALRRTASRLLTSSPAPTADGYFTNSDTNNSGGALLVPGASAIPDMLGVYHSITPPPQAPDALFADDEILLAAAAAGITLPNSVLDAAAAHGGGVSPSVGGGLMPSATFAAFAGPDGDSAGGQTARGRTKSVHILGGPLPRTPLGESSAGASGGDVHAQQSTASAMANATLKVSRLRAQMRAAGVTGAALVRSRQGTLVRNASTASTVFGGLNRSIGGFSSGVDLEMVEEGTDEAHRRLPALGNLSELDRRSRPVSRQLGGDHHQSYDYEGDGGGLYSRDPDELDHISGSGGPRRGGGGGGRPPLRSGSLAAPSYETVDTVGDEHEGEEVPGRILAGGEEEREAEDLMLDSDDENDPVLGRKGGRRVAPTYAKPAHSSFLARGAASGTANRATQKGAGTKASPMLALMPPSEGALTQGEDTQATSSAALIAGTDHQDGTNAASRPPSRIVNLPLRSHLAKHPALEALRTRGVPVTIPSNPTSTATANATRKKAGSTHPECADDMDGMTAPDASLRSADLQPLPGPSPPYGKVLLVPVSGSEPTMPFALPAVVTMTAEEKVQRQVQHHDRSSRDTPLMRARSPMFSNESLQQHRTGERLRSAGGPATAAAASSSSSTPTLGVARSPTPSPSGGDGSGVQKKSGGFQVLSARSITGDDDDDLFPHAPDLPTSRRSGPAGGLATDRSGDTTGDDISWDVPRSAALQHPDHPLRSTAASSSATKEPAAAGDGKKTHGLTSPTTASLRRIASGSTAPSHKTSARDGGSGAMVVHVGGFSRTSSRGSTTRGPPEEEAREERRSDVRAAQRGHQHQQQEEKRESEGPSSEHYQLRRRLLEAETRVRSLEGTVTRLQQKLAVYKKVDEHLHAANEVGRLVELGSGTALALLLGGYLKGGSGGVNTAGHAHGSHPAPSQFSFSDEAMMDIAAGGSCSQRSQPHGPLQRAETLTMTSTSPSRASVTAVTSTPPTRHSATSHPPHPHPHLSVPAASASAPLSITARIAQETYLALVDDLTRCCGLGDSCQVAAEEGSATMLDTTHAGAPAAATATLGPLFSAFRTGTLVDMAVPDHQRDMLSIMGAGSHGDGGAGGSPAAGPKGSGAAAAASGAPPQQQLGRKRSIVGSSSGGAAAPMMLRAGVQQSFSPDESQSPAPTARSTMNSPATTGANHRRQTGHGPAWRAPLASTHILMQLLAKAPADVLRPMVAPPSAAISPTATASGAGGISKKGSDASRRGGAGAGGGKRAAFPAAVSAGSENNDDGGNTDSGLVSLTATVSSAQGLLSADHHHHQQQRPLPVAAAAPLPLHRILQLLSYSGGAFAGLLAARPIGWVASALGGSVRQLGRHAQPSLFDEHALSQLALGAEERYALAEGIVLHGTHHHQQQDQQQTHGDSSAADNFSGATAVPSTEDGTGDDSSRGVDEGSRANKVEASRSRLRSVAASTISTATAAAIHSDISSGAQKGPARASGAGGGGGGVAAMDAHQAAQHIATLCGVKLHAPTAEQSGGGSGGGGGGGKKKGKGGAGSGGGGAMDQQEMMLAQVRAALSVFVSSRPHPLDGLTPQAVAMASDVQAVLNTIGGPLVEAQQQQQLQAQRALSMTEDASDRDPALDATLSALAQQPQQQQRSAPAGKGAVRSAAASTGVMSATTPALAKAAAKSFAGLTPTQQEARVLEWVTSYAASPHLRNMIKVQNAVIELLLTMLVVEPEGAAAAAEEFR